MSSSEQHLRETSLLSSLSPSPTSQQTTATWVPPDFDGVLSGAEVFHAPTPSGPSLEWAAQLYRLASDTINDIQELAAAVRGQTHAVEANRYGRLRTAYYGLADTIKGLLSNTIPATIAATRQATLRSCDQFACPLWTEVARITHDTDQRYKAIERLGSLAERQIARQEDTHRPPLPTSLPPRQDDSEAAQKLRALEETIKTAAAMLLSNQHTPVAQSPISTFSAPQALVAPSPISTSVIPTPSARQASVATSATPTDRSASTSDKATVMNKPTTYDGKNRERFRPWWRSINDFLRLLQNTFQTDSEKITYVGSLMTDRAAEWHYERIPEGDGIIPETWHSYSLAIQERFRDPSE
ncbi:hypothetical protein SEPCBS119000_006774, partial [Sporothrix epigloea]